MNILILNWRDIKNPKSGGAEILTHELAKGLVGKGHRVTQFSSFYKDAKKEETIDGVKIIREGKPDIRHLLSSVHYKAYKFYKNNEEKYDLVIDEVHGVPFFTPLYVKEKKIALICEVAGNIWDMSFSFPFSKLGRAFERIYPNFYSKVKIVTISNSSKKELSEIGFKKEKISVIPLGCNVPLVKGLGRKPNSPTLVFVSRLTKSKGVEDAIRATGKVKDKIKDIRTIIIGRGSKDYTDYLKRLVKSLGLEKNVSFSGFISEKEKWNLLEKAHILLVSSSKEGWGLTVHEAGSRATPAIGYNVEGLRDVIIDGTNGVLCKKNNYHELTTEVLNLMKDKKRYRNMQLGALSERKKFTWGKTVIEFNKIISK